MAIIAGVAAMVAALAICLSLQNRDRHAQRDLRGKLGDYVHVQGEAHEATTPTYEPTYERLQRLVKEHRGKVASRAPYKTDDDDDIKANISIYELGQSAYVWTADMDVDCDGKKSKVCNRDTDDAYLNETRFPDEGPPLDAAKVPYFVIPEPSKERFDYRKAGIVGGAVGIVMYNGKFSYGVFGDTGPKKIIGEASYALVKSLGASPNPSNGGVDDIAVTYIVFKGSGAVPKDISNPGQAQKLGEELVAKLLQSTNVLPVLDEMRPASMKAAECVALAKGTTPPMGGGTWKCVPATYTIQQPYHVDDNVRRFTAQNDRSTYTFKVYGDDVSFKEGSGSKPRTEMRFCSEHKSGVHQFAAKVKIPKGTDQVNIFQIKPKSDKYHPDTWQLRVIKGDLKTGPAPFKVATVASDIYDKELQVNVLYDATGNGNTVMVYVNESDKPVHRDSGLFDGERGVEFYFKCGTYATLKADKSHRLMQAVYRNITIYERQEGGSRTELALSAAGGDNGEVTAAVPSFPEEEEEEEELQGPHGGQTLARRGDVLYSLSKTKGTYYYDLKTPCPQDLGGYQETNDGTPFCSSWQDPSKQKTLRQYGSNNVIAIDRNVLSKRRNVLCGKKAIVKVNGVQVHPSGGDFVVWDGCEACVGGGRVDFSVSGAKLLNRDACTLGVVPGVSVEVIDEQVWRFVP